MSPTTTLYKIQVLQEEGLRQALDLAEAPSDLMAVRLDDHRQMPVTSHLRMRRTMRASRIHKSCKNRLPLHHPYKIDSVLSPQVL
jgi:hypothetical protein